MARTIISRLTSKKSLIIIGLLAAAIGYYYYFYSATEETATAITTYVVDTVEAGSVSTGIETTGEIVAAQTLDLDVYKQSERIELVNFANGAHVEEGDIILSFDKSDAYVNVESSQVNVTEAQLALNEEQTNYTDQNTTLLSLENDIKNLNTSIAQVEQDKQQAYRDFLNADLEAESGNSKTEEKVGPTISGLYTAKKEVVYRVSVYASGASSGYSYRVYKDNVLIETDSLIFNLKTPLGSDGLSVTFSSAASVQNGDEWLIAVPNVYAAEYVQNLEDYEENMVNLDESIESAKLSIVSKQQEIENLTLTDSTSYRDLNVAQAEAQLSKAQVQLSQYYDKVEEQDIIAPFSGTIDGMQNVVVGATPTNDTNDSISLGTLISDDFLVTFSLGIVDVSKVELGQKVYVSISSFPEMEALEASITEISALPDSSGVAQYEVQALITVPENLDFQLREGLLADVEIVEEEVDDVVRVPQSAVTYVNGEPTVTMLDNLTEQQQTMIERIGIVRDPNNTASAYPVTIEVGLTGAYYVEVTSGLSAGDLIVTSSNTETSEEESVVNQNFRPGGGEPPEGGGGTGAGMGAGRSASGG